MARTPRPLSPDEAGSRLRARFGDDVLDVTEQDGHAVATVPVSATTIVCLFLRDEPEFDCDYCDFTGGVDFGRRPASRSSRTCSPPATITTCG